MALVPPIIAPGAALRLKVPRHPGLTQREEISKSFVAKRRWTAFSMAAAIAPARHCRPKAAPGFAQLLHPWPWKNLHFDLGGPSVQAPKKLGRIVADAGLAAPGHGMIYDPTHSLELPPLGPPRNL